MFTGIVEEMGAVKDIDFSGNINKLRIQCNKVLQDIRMGDSIAVNGVCLTVSQLGNEWFGADVMPETIRKTSLSELKPGQKVNLEPSLSLGGRIGGHIVSGHIDDVGIIKQIKKEQNAEWLIIEIPAHIEKYIVMKGSVAVDGTSLTVGYLEGAHFGVSLIPATRSITTLGCKKTGDKVNVECDIVAKYIERLFKSGENDSSSKADSITMSFLQQNGFI